MKKILITGVSSGIGYQTAKLLSSHEYKIYGTFNKNNQGADSLKKEVKSLELFQVDLSNRDATLNFLNQIKDLQFEAIINNAGVIEFESWDDLKMETWDKLFEVNLNAPMLITHTLRNNIASGGSIINIASTDGMKGSISSIAYSATKAGLINLTQSLANVFGKSGVRVNAIAPGWIGDGMGSPAIPDAKWLNPLSRTASYEEVAKVIRFLISDDSSFINGQTIVVDGGSSTVDYVLKRESELL